MRSGRDSWLTTIGITILVDLAVVVLITSTEPREEWANDLTFALLLASTLSLLFGAIMTRKISRCRLLTEELGRLLERDRLTDVATRDFFYKRMSDSPDTYGLSLMVDIDHFKAVNDTYGHHAGDAVLRHVAQVLRRNCRKRDIVCRFGGEEFVVFLFGVGKEHGFEVAERIRKVVASAAMTHGDHEMRVTVSIGGSIKESADEIEFSIRQADAALYRAKELGRNRSFMNWFSREPSAQAAA